MREPGRVFTRTEFCERVWEREHEYDMKLVEVFISRLRRKIDVAAAHPNRAASRLHHPRNAMKNWPLRWKVALYSALLALAATIGGAATTWTVMRYEEIAAFDRRLTMDAHELFRDVQHFAARPEPASASDFQEIFVPSRSATASSR